VAARAAIVVCTQHRSIADVRVLLGRRAAPLRVEVRLIDSIGRNVTYR
jgi:hypothetical protein